MFFRNKNSFRVFYLRSINKISRYLVRFLKLQTRHALGYGYKTYLKRLVKENADLYIGHEEMSLPLIIDLKKKNKKAVFDFEDFHSEDLLPKDRRYRPISLLESYEKEWEKVSRVYKSLFLKLDLEDGFYVNAKIDPDLLFIYKNFLG